LVTPPHALKIFQNMKKSLVYLFTTVLLGAAFTLPAQDQPAKPPRWMGMQVRQSSEQTICYAGAANLPANLPPPAAYQRWRAANRNNARTASARFEVTYEGFTPEAQAVFEEAVNIWSALIESPVPIRIRAVWTSLGANVLGGAQTGSYVGNFFGAPRLNVWYPVALAEKIMGREINEATQPDIVAFFNNSTNWHLGITEPPPPGRFDLLTVVLHEIGHGLGIIHGFAVSDGSASLPLNGFPVVTHTFMENGAAQNLVSNFAAPGPLLAAQLTNQDLHWNSPLVQIATLNQRARLFAPTTFAPGNSIAHLDEETYSFPSTNPDRLMTPFINPAERALDPGPIALNMLYDMGWRLLPIEHRPVPNTENVTTAYTVTARIPETSGLTPDPASVRLRYTTDGTNFTEVPMTTTAPNEFQAAIPPGHPQYGYTISARDNFNRTRTIPGISFPQNGPPPQQLFTFTAGPDTRPPVISHAPKAFVKLSDNQLPIEAVVSDNIGVQQVALEYNLNGGALQTLPMTLKPNTDSTYMAAITWLPGQLAGGNRIEYRIRARDQAVAQNQSARPSATTFFSVNVVSLAPTQDEYVNNFNDITAAAQDFFGDAGFSIRLEPGFADGAIHTQHPYPEGRGFPNDQFEWVFQLRVPIRVKETEATVRFDEIVLVEPGRPGSTFPSMAFYDFVVVDGSKDGGVTWTPVAPGYDSRDNADWLARYNSSIVNDISRGVGDPALFRPRTLNLQDRFDIGDEVVLRFRLFSDWGAAGWGWAIDNLRIQVDDIPPRILHNHHDMLLPSATVLPITFRPSDAGGLKNLSVEFALNTGPVTTQAIPVTAGVTDYTLNIDLTAAQIRVGDHIRYRIRATDMADNAAVLPAIGFFEVAVLSLAQPITSYVSNFNSANADFAGNFFSVTQPGGFANGAIHSQHPYPMGFGLNGVSSFAYILRRPIRISAANSLMVLDEIVVTEFDGSSVKDFVTVEATKDGLNWETVVAPYSSGTVPAWAGAFNNNAIPAPSLFRQRMADLTQTGRFAAGEVVLLRFRLQSDAQRNGWGWAIDNLSIQGPITGVETTAAEWLRAYPNPANDRLVLEIAATASFDARVLTLQGAPVWQKSGVADAETITENIDTAAWAAGVYLVQVNTDAGVVTRKVVIRH
jgi:hypothetical protein